ncbi:MAG: alpha/beta fold hydrolase [Bacteroidota bacterium]
MKHFGIFLFVLFSYSSFLGQDLPRKGSFGCHMKDADDGNGIAVVRVIENSTAFQMGLKENDVIHSLNDNSLKNVGHFVAEIGNWKAGEKIELGIHRNSEDLELKGEVIGKPFETSAQADVLYGHVDYQGNRLRSILEIPKQAVNPPVVYFLPGIGCASIDYYYDHNAPIKKLVEEFVAKGLAVFRIEKPGMGDSDGPLKCTEMDFNQEVEALKAGLQELQKNKNIDRENIFLYGHSLGTVSAPLVAKDQGIKGIIAWGGISSSWYEYSLRILKDQKILKEMDYVQIEKEYREIQPFYHAFYEDQKSPQELMEDERFRDLTGNYFDGDLWFGMHHYRYFHTLNKVDMFTAYKEANCSVLTLAGDCDLHAIDTKWASDIVQSILYYDLYDADLKVFENTTHHYHTVPSMQEYIRMRKEGTLNNEYMAANFNEEVPISASNWIWEKVKK